MSTPIVIAAPASKSLSHRAIIAASLAQGVSQLNGVLESEDTLRTMDIMRRCGATISRLAKGSYTVAGVSGSIIGGTILNDSIASNTVTSGAVEHRGETDCPVGESGTTCRLLTAVLATGKGSFYFYGTGRMHERPMKELTSILSQCGCDFAYDEKPGFLPFHMHTQGLFQPQSANGPVDIFVPSTESSQYCSGLLLAAPASKDGLQIVFDGSSAVSKSYILLTLQTLLLHHVPFSLEYQPVESDGAWMPCQDIIQRSSMQSSTSTSQERQTVDLQGLMALKHSRVWRQRVRVSIPACGYLPFTGQVEGDYSGASYLLAAGALGNRPVTVTGLNQNSLQGDAAILDILQRMGASIEWTVINGLSAVTVYPSALKGISIDMGDCPDLVPTVTMLAARASSPTTISNVAHLTLKESNRLLAPAQELARIGCTTTLTDSSITIYPLTSVTDPNPVLSSHNDHRMAMSLALLELGDDITIRLDNDQCVVKSYPDFWQDWSLIRPDTNLGKRNGQTESISIAIIGNKGSMGSMLQQRLANAGFTVRGMDIRDIQPNDACSANTPRETDTSAACTAAPTIAAKTVAEKKITTKDVINTKRLAELMRKTLQGCAVVLVCVPVNSLKNLLKTLGPMLHENQLLMDVSSVKCTPMQYMEESFAGSVIGSHPLFGPQPLPEDMRTILVQGKRASKDDCLLAEQIFTALNSKIHWTTAEEHDKGVAIAQSLNFTVSAAFFSTLRNVPDIEYFLTPSFKRHLEAARKHLTQDTEMFLEFSAMNPFFALAVESYTTTLNRILDGELRAVAHEAQQWYASSAGPK